MGFYLSGHAALCGLKPLSSLSMPSAVMLMSGIFGWGLGWNARLATESCKSCNDFWARDLNLWGLWGLTLNETGHLRHLLFLLPLKEFDHPSLRDQCHLSLVWSA